MAVIAHDGRRRSVAALDQLAFRAGIRPGMAGTKATVLVPDLQLVDADPIADRDGLHSLALWALRRYSPVVSVDGKDGLVIESDGADHLFGGEATLIEDLVARVNAAGVDARAAVADSWGAAHAIARFSRSRHFVADRGASEQLLRPMQIAALRLPPDIVGGLRVLGFERIGDLLSTPRAPLALRFGPEIGRRIDQALGTLSELIEPLRSPEIVEVRQAFAEPIGAAETIIRYVGKLAERLCIALTERGLGVLRLDLVCQRVDSRCQAVRVGLAQPVRDVGRITRLLSDKVETIDPGFGIEMMTLAAVLTQSLEYRQDVSSLIEVTEPDVSDLVDTLANRIGEDRIYRAAPVASDVPERTVARVAPLSPDTGADWPDHWPRPARLMPRPEPIDAIALLPDNPPAAFTWRGVRRRVRRADGPERVFGEWWKADAELEAVRDYFRVEDDAGERYWIFRAGDGEDPATGSQAWFIHGVFG